jgi:hypothetical protein
VKPGAIPHATRTLGGGLAIHDQVNENGEAVMLSAWEPSTEELDRLMKGAPVILFVGGTLHPAVGVGVGHVIQPTQ